MAGLSLLDVDVLFVLLGGACMLPFSPCGSAMSLRCCILKGRGVSVRESRWEIVGTRGLVGECRYFEMRILIDGKRFLTSCSSALSLMPFTMPLFLKPLFSMWLFLMPLFSMRLFEDLGSRSCEAGVVDVQNSAMLWKM